MEDSMATPIQALKKAAQTAQQPKPQAASPPPASSTTSQPKPKPKNDPASIPVPAHTKQNIHQNMSLQPQAPMMQNPNHAHTHSHPHTHAHPHQQQAMMGGIGAVGSVGPIGMNLPQMQGQFDIKEIVTLVIACTICFSSQMQDMLLGINFLNTNGKLNIIGTFILAVILAVGFVSYKSFH